MTTRQCIAVERVVHSEPPSREILRDGEMALLSTGGVLEIRKPSTDADAARFLHPGGVMRNRRRTSAVQESSALADGRCRLFRALFALSTAFLASVLFAACAASHPQDDAPPPVLSKTTWDDASDRGAPSDSLWRNLYAVLSLRTDIVVLAKDSQPESHHRHGMGGSGGEGGGGHHHGGYGGGGGGDGGFGGDAPQRPNEGGEEHGYTPLRLLLAGTVERWDVDSERAALDAASRPPAPSDSLRGGPVQVSLRLVSKATGRVVWRKLEDCTPWRPSSTTTGDSAAVHPGWAAGFQACREEILRNSARDVPAAALELAGQAAVSEAAERAEN